MGLSIYCCRSCASLDTICICLGVLGCPRSPFKLRGSALARDAIRAAKAGWSLGHSMPCSVNWAGSYSNSNEASGLQKPYLSASSARIFARSMPIAAPSRCTAAYCCRAKRWPNKGAAPSASTLAFERSNVNSLVTPPARSSTLRLSTVPQVPQSQAPSSPTGHCKCKRWSGQHWKPSFLSKNCSSDWSVVMRAIRVSGRSNGRYSPLSRWPPVARHTALRHARFTEG
mmetsp:Transcript_10659/g.29534  ORF Transcript_10659/g.29534 Transcript_10659/m.29534 type:complete len:228 (-) Transcript_10659:470-1153(-)